MSNLLLIGNFLSSKGLGYSVIEDLAEKLKKAGFGVFKASSYASGWLRAAHMIYITIRYHNQYELAVIDLFSGKAFFWGEAVAYILSFFKKPFIFVLRGGALPDFSQRHPNLVKTCLKKAVKVVAPSDYLAEKMRLYRNDLISISNPIDVAKYNFGLRQNLKSKLVWMRAFHKIYNPSLAPKVISILKRDFSDICLIMVGPNKGDGSLEETQEEALRLGVKDNVSFAGAASKKEVPVWLNRGDIFINTTNVDNTPISVIEAMACGLCVVSTNVGGIPYLLKHEEDALLVPPNDPTAMATAIRRILIDPNLAERLSINARKKAERFDWSEILPQWEALFESMVEQ